MITTLLVDGHVHYHPCFETQAFLEAASANFEAARRQVGRPDAVGCLMFSESSWSHYYRAFADGMVQRATSDWTVEGTREEGSIVVHYGSDARLVLVAGRQIVTADRLEVLALASVHEYPDGLPTAEAVTLTLSRGALAVIPWGFGKWTGHRGRIVRDLLTSPLADRIYLGDNGGRPALGASPALFRLAQEEGVPILPGSDPLPIPGEVTKPGRYGFMLEGEVDLGAPALAISTMLAARSQPRRYGRLEGLATFVHRQAMLRLRPGDKTIVPGPRDSVRLQP